MQPPAYSAGSAVAAEHDLKLQVQWTVLISRHCESFLFFFFEKGTAKAFNDPHSHPLFVPAEVLHLHTLPFRLRLFFPYPRQPRQSCLLPRLTSLRFQVYNKHLLLASASLSVFAKSNSTNWRKESCRISLAFSVGGCNMPRTRIELVYLKHGIKATV
jgi:hypothetical protein